VAALLGEYSLLIVPFIVTAMMRGYGLSETHAGYMVTLQLFAMAAAGIAVSYGAKYVQARTIAIVAAVAIIAANFAAAIGSGTALLGVARAMTGLGEGALMAAAGALAAHVRNPHRLFSLLGLVIAAVAASALLLTPFLFSHLGVKGIFWLLAASPVAVLLSARGLPKLKLDAAEAPRLGAFSVGGAPPALIAFALLWIGAGALWVFAERIGTAQGLSLLAIGRYLAIGQIAGLLGPILSDRLGERLGLKTSIGVGSAGMAVGGLLMAQGSLPSTYVLGVSLLSIAIMFLTPCFRTLMALLDHTGSVVAASVAFYTIGFGLAPLVVGWMEQAGASYGTIAWLTTGLFVASGLLGLRAQSSRVLTVP
jgi:predicted MFS family arabinose efflux permease